jgi:hypothetical protein
MFDKIRVLNPKHKEPRWESWSKTIRLMRERDGRPHREIAELFSWANAHKFWHTNILCPTTLREQWDKLTIARRAEGGNGAHAPDPLDDGLCSRILPSGLRCSNPWTWKQAGRKPLCRVCLVEVDREGLRAPSATAGHSNA